MNKYRLFFIDGGSPLDISTKLYLPVLEKYIADKSVVRFKDVCINFRYVIYIKTLEEDEEYE